MAEAFKQLLLEAGVESLAGVDGFAEALCPFFANAEELVAGLLEEPSQNRLMWLKEVDAAKAVLWSVKLNFALKQKNGTISSSSDTNHTKGAFIPKIPLHSWIIRRRTSL